MGIHYRLASIAFPECIASFQRSRIQNDETIFLMYHEVLPATRAPESWLVVDEDQFIEQMEYLKNNYNVISIEGALSKSKQQRKDSSGKNPDVVVTFDDGYLGNLTIVLPIMERLQLPFTIYISTACIERGVLNWHDQVIISLLSSDPAGVEIDTSLGKIHFAKSQYYMQRQWDCIEAVLTHLKLLSFDERNEIAKRLRSASGDLNISMLSPDDVWRLSRSDLVTLGNHSHDHELLDQLSSESVSSSISQAQKLLNAWTGRFPEHFAYPNGNYNSEIIRLVQSAGFLSAVTTRIERWRPLISRYEIPRLHVGRYDKLSHFRANCCGFLS